MYQKEDGEMGTKITISLTEIGRILFALAAFLALNPASETPAFHSSYTTSSGAIRFQAGGFRNGGENKELADWGMGRHLKERRDEVGLWRRITALIKIG